MAEQASPPVSRHRRWPFIFLMGLAAASLLLHAIKYSRGREIAERQRQYAELMRTRPIAATKARRVRFYQIRYFLAYPMTVSYAAADLIRSVDAIAQPLRLLAVQVDPAVQDLGFKLTLEATGVGPREARRRLAFFLERLRNVPGVTTADISRPGPTVQGRGARVFAVDGRAELQP